MENNRDKLIQVAAGLFMRYGFHGTSVDDILDESGVAKSNLYYHFARKDDLAEAVTDFWVNDYEINLINASLGDDSLDVWDRLRSLFRHAAASQNGEEGLIGCPLARLSSELANELPQVQRKIDLYFTSLKNRIATLLMTAEGSCLRDKAALRVAGTVVTVLEGGLLLSGLRKNGVEVAEPGSTLIDLIQASQARIF